MKHFPISSFKAKLVAAVCIVNILVVLVISGFISNWFYNQIVSQTTEQTQLIIEQVGTNVDTYMNELYRLTLAPYYNDNVMGELEHSPADSQSQLASKRVVEDFLSSVMTLPRSEVLRVYVMSEGGLYSYTRTPYEMTDYRDYQNTEWYLEALSTTRPILIPPQLEKVFGEKRTPVFSVVRQIRSKNDNSITCGVIKVDADYTGIKKICEKVDLKSSGILLITNEQNQILYQSAQLPAELTVSQLNTSDSKITVASNQKYMVNRYNLSTYGIQIVALHSYAELMRPLWENFIKTTILALSCIIIAGVFITFIIRKFLEPLFQIMGLMKEVEDGNLEVFASVNTKDEMSSLADSFNHMVRNLDTTMKHNEQLVRKIYQAQYLAKEAQYNSLCSQIKPHFLYNTLNTISLLIKCDEGSAAVKAIEDLSHYLGGIMNVDREIALKQELQICESYLGIVYLRYQDRLTYSIEVSPTLLAETIPSLTLQSLVENSVKHACESKRGLVSIALFTREFSDRFELIVKDNGKGISKDKLQEIQNSFADSENDDTDFSDSPLLGNIGLVNIYRRLQLKFGASAQFLIKSSESKGTEVIINLPKSSC